MTARTSEERQQDRADLHQLLVEAADTVGPVTLHAIAAATWDGTTSWPGHAERVWGDLEAMRRDGVVACRGALLRVAMATLWGPADSPFGDACSDAAEVRRLTAGWEPLPDVSEVPC